jgi:hypothetical protein
MREAAGPLKEKTMIRKHPVGAFTLKSESTVPQSKIHREQVLAKLWELANLTPEETKGNVTGQLKALEALCEELGLKPIDTNRPASQEIYRSAWMSPRPTRTN